MKRIMLFLFLFLFSLSFAIYPGNITITPFESKDFGNEGLPAFDVTVTADCLAVEINQYTSSQGTPVSGAMGYLKQVQYTIPLISSGSTDSSGYLTHQLPGNISFYTGLFTLTVEKSGYRKKELHFDVSGCFVNVTPPTPPNITPPSPPNITPPAPPPNITPPSPSPNITQPANVTPNVTAECTKNADCTAKINCSANETYVAPKCTNGTCTGEKCQEPGPSVCPIGFIIALIVPIILAIRNKS